MGLFQKLLDAIPFLAKPQCKVLCVGLDNSGKSTVLQHLKLKQGAVKDITPTVGFNVERLRTLTLFVNVFQVIQHLKLKQGAVKDITPTVGFNVEQFSRSSINFTVFDMSGAGKYRNLWEHYYKDAQAIIFVIDCSDKLRMCVVKEELQAMLAHADTKGVPTLFFANKIDISDHLNPVECVQYLDLDAVKDRPWHITPSNALSGYGLDDGISWISEHLRV